MKHSMPDRNRLPAYPEKYELGHKGQQYFAWAEDGSSRIEDADGNEVLYVSGHISIGMAVRLLELHDRSYARGLAAGRAVLAAQLRTLLGAEAARGVS